MTWKRRAVVIGLGFLVVKAPHLAMSTLHEVGASLATFWHTLNLH